MKPINSTTVRKYYQALSSLYNFLIRDEVLDISPLIKIKAPKEEKKVVKSLSSTEVNQLILSFRDTFDGIRNRAIILVLVDCGLRLGELLNIKLVDINMEQQLVKADGKTGERVVRFGSTTAKAMVEYLKLRSKVDGHNDSLWLTEKGITLKDSKCQ